MLFRKIVFGLLTLLLGLAAISFGILFIVCLSLYLLWQGLSTSVIMFGVLSALCVVVAYKALKRTVAGDKMKLPVIEPTLISEALRQQLARSQQASHRQKQPKIL
jgi:hypothetical protein